MRANPDRAAHGQIFTRPDVRCFSQMVSFGTAKWVVPPLPKTTHGYLWYGSLSPLPLRRGLKSFYFFSSPCPATLGQYISNRRLCRNGEKS
jgi:hypothetical protein